MTRKNFLTPLAAWARMMAQLVFFDFTLNHDKGLDNNMTTNKVLTSQDRLLSALRKGMRVTRRTAIEHGWCENLTATISSLRDKGYQIEPFIGIDDNGNAYTRYKLVGDINPVKIAA